MFILAECTFPPIITGILSQLYKIIIILVPIGIVIFGSIDFIKATIAKDSNAIAASVKTFINRLITGCIRKGTLFARRKPRQTLQRGKILTVRICIGMEKIVIIGSKRLTRCRRSSMGSACGFMSAPRLMSGTTRKIHSFCCL